MNLAAAWGTRWPLIQAPMAGVQGSALALAVCQAGALGSLPGAMLSPQALGDELAAMKAGTPAPFNVNFFCHTPPVPQPEREAAWHKVLAPYLREFGLEGVAPPAGPGRAPFDAAMAAVLEATPPAVVSFHFGLPPAPLLQRVRALGCTILSSATTVEEARWLAAQGVDAIIAQGVEAGGHRGMFLSSELSTQMGTLALLPQVVRAVNLPVLAAGGIADAAGVAAAMRLGAAGVQVGTAYLLCAEATTSVLHRQALKSPQAEHTALTTLFTGRPARGIVNRVMRELGPIHPATPDFPLAAALLAPLRAAAEKAGDAGFTPLWSGQNARGCREVGAAELTRALAEGFGG